MLGFFVLDCSSYMEQSNRMNIEMSTTNLPCNDGIMFSEESISRMLVSPQTYYIMSEDGDLIAGRNETIGCKIVARVENASYKVKVIFKERFLHFVIQREVFYKMVMNKFASVEDSS